MMRTALDFFIIFSILLLSSCGGSSNSKTDSIDMEKFRSTFEKDILVLLEGDPEMESDVIDVQTFINEENVEFIPVFTSQEKLLESTGGVELGNTMAMNGFFYLSLGVDSNNIMPLRLNPALKDEQYVDPLALRKFFKKEIEEAAAAALK